jgi:hypothetical protein
MTDEQFANWLKLETGMDGWEFCLRETDASWLRSKLGNRYCVSMRHPDWVVYDSVGLKPRISPARHLGNDVPGGWTVIHHSEVPERQIQKLVKMIKEGMK